MQLEELFDYKNKLMEDLITNESIVELVGEGREADTLPYNQIFPYEFFPETIQDGYTYICFDVDIQKSTSKTYLLPTIYVWVFSHKSRLRLPDGKGVRPDKICEEISKAINGSRYYGLGELNLYSVKRFAPMSDYIGKVMTFYTTDFNRQYDGKKPVPVNRKMG